MAIRLFFPFLYSIIMGCAWGTVFKKRFRDSLAPALMAHTILVIISGLVFSKLSYGIFAGILFSAVAVVLGIVELYKKHGIDGFKERIGEEWNNGLLLFVLFYFFCFVINYKKRFISWDEFSHWGMFLKENLRLDSLYCTSPLKFSHKDYVPAVTVFLTIWCRIVGRFQEADAYRGIQIFMFSLLLPMFGKIRNIKDQLFSLLLVLLIPLVFNTDNGFMFYHSIYCDLAMSLVFFYCALVVYRDQEDIWYQSVLLTIALTVLVLTKMIAMAFLPMILALLLLKHLCLREYHIQFRKYLYFIPALVVPTALWLWFNRYVKVYIPDMVGRQSFASMNAGRIFEAFRRTELSAIPYIEALRRLYVPAVFTRDILLHGSYTTVLIAIVVIFCIISKCQMNKKNKKKTLLVALWVLLCGIAYAILMYCLYATAFTEREALELTSYERYMNIYAALSVFLLIAVYFDSETWHENMKMHYCIVILLTFDLLFLHIGVFKQVIPGVFSRDDEEIAEYVSYADAISDATPEDARICLVTNYDNGFNAIHQSFYCSPRIIKGICPWSPGEDDLAISEDELNGFKEMLSEYDYIYFTALDDIFNEKYGSVFESSDLIRNGKIYRIIQTNPQIVIAEVY